MLVIWVNKSWGISLELISLNYELYGFMLFPIHLQSAINAAMWQHPHATQLLASTRSAWSGFGAFLLLSCSQRVAFHDSLMSKSHFGSRRGLSDISGRRRRRREQVVDTT